MKGVYIQCVRRVRNLTFAVGQTVWLYWPKPLIRQQRRKLTQLWTGPWIVEKFIFPIVVQLSHPLNRKRQTVHVDRLVPCLTPRNSLIPLSSRNRKRDYQGAHQSYRRRLTISSWILLMLGMLLIPNQNKLEVDALCAHHFVLHKRCIVL